MKKLVFLLFLFTINMHIHARWTWQYKKIFSPADAVINEKKTEFKFIKLDVPHFSQMIISWNGIRPKKGYFTFWAQVRDVNTKKWHNWHKMLEWGANIQRSFFSEAETTYHHVRLEVPTNKLADGLRIRVESQAGANLADLRALFVCISDFSKFMSEPVYLFKNLPSLEINDIPRFSQMELDHPKKDVLCSPTSCSMVTSYLTGSLIDPVQFANSCYDTGLCAYGSWPYNTAHAYECCDEKIFFNVTRLNSFMDLYSFLQKKIPVIVSVRGYIQGAPQEYKQGHLLVVTGWDEFNKQVICHDPAFANSKDTRVHYNAKSFLQAWERSRRLAYIAQPINK